MVHGGKLTVKKIKNLLTKILNYWYKNKCQNTESRTEAYCRSKVKRQSSDKN